MEFFREVRLDRVETQCRRPYPGKPEHVAGHDDVRLAEHRIGKGHVETEGLTIGLAREFPFNTAQGAQLRIAYAFDPTRNAVLVLGSAKAGDDRFYRWFIPQAESVWEQYLKEQGVTA